MAPRRLVPPSVRDTLLGIPSDTTSLERNYVLADEDLELIGTRRRAANRLGLAVHIALLRHPGQDWLADTHVPGSCPGLACRAGRRTGIGSDRLRHQGRDAFQP